MKKIVDILGEHAFFQELTSDDLEFIAGCGKNVVFEEKAILASPGETADEFYLIRHGRVALILEIIPYKPLIIETLGPNQICGLSWMIPPYRWNVTVQATEPIRAIAIDGACLRKKCEKDPALGYKLMKHLVQVLVAREDAIRLHLCDVYGSKNK